MSREAFEEKYAQSWADTPPHVRKLWLEAWQAAEAQQEARVRELEEQVKMLATLLSEHVENDQMEWDEDDWVERSARAIYDIDFDDSEQALSATAREVDNAK